MSKLHIFHVLRKFNVDKEIVFCIASLYGVSDLYSLHIGFAGGLNHDVKLCSVRYVGVGEMDVGVLFGTSEGQDVWGGTSCCAGKPQLIVMYSSQNFHWYPAHIKLHKKGKSTDNTGYSSMLEVFNKIYF